MLNAANKTDQSLLDFQNGINTAAYTTSEIEQLIFHVKIVTMCTTASLQDSEWQVNSVSGVHDLLNKIRDIEDKAVSKEVGNATCILAFFLILLTGNVINDGICSSLFGAPSRTLFLLVRLVLWTFQQESCTG